MTARIRLLLILPALFVLLGFSTLLAQGGGKPKNGPFDPEAWPPARDASKIVHFIDLDGKLTSPGPNWTPNLKVLTGGDHVTEAVGIGGHKGVKVGGIKFNTADDAFPIWARETCVDVLMQVYGDGAFLDDRGQPKYFDFLTGTLPEPIAVVAGTIPTEAKNGRWNWVLFRVSNGLRHMDGGRLIGTIHPKAKADPAIAEVSRLSGQNGGTIRMDGLHDLKIRVIAFGQRGAFGEPEQVNRFRR